MKWYTVEFDISYNNSVMNKWYINSFRYENLDAAKEYANRHNSMTNKDLCQEYGEEGNEFFEILSVGKARVFEWTRTKI